MKSVPMIRCGNHIALWKQLLRTERPKGWWARIWWRMTWH